MEGRRHGEESTAARDVLRVSGIVTRVLAAGLSLVLVVYIGYLWQTVRGLNDNVQRVQVLKDGQTINPKTGKTITRHDIDGTDQNLLIFGNDDRSDLTDAQVRELKVGRDRGSLNTDTMMIVHVPADGSRATLISLPRDSYVHIPGYGMNKLNAAYPDGYFNARGDRPAKVAAGASLLIHTVENLTGLNIDHFVEVSMLGFVAISDAIHGVRVNLCEAVNDTVAHDRANGIQGGSGLVLSKGVHHIQGVQALEFVRQRHGLPGEDVGRTARQRYFLTAAFRQVASAGTLLDIGALRSLIAAVDKSLYVDQNLNMLDLAKQMSSLSADNIRGEVIPTDHYVNVTINGYYPVNVGIVIPSQIRSFVHKIIDGSSSAHHKAKPVAPSTVSVDVRNFGGPDRAAAASVAALTTAGFRAVVDRTSGHQTRTTIAYPRGSAARARTLARYVPGAQLQQAQVSRLTLTLGSDGLGAKPTPTARHRKPRAIDSSCVH